MTHGRFTHTNELDVLEREHPEEMNLAFDWFYENGIQGYWGFILHNNTYSDDILKRCYKAVTRAWVGPCA